MTSNSKDKSKNKIKDKITTIRCPMSTKKRLREYELHSRESDNDIIIRVLNKIDSEAGKWKNRTMCSTD